MSLDSLVILEDVFRVQLHRLELFSADRTLNHLDRLFIPRAFLVAVCPRLIRSVIFVRG